MANDISALEPQLLWKHFAALNAVPRPSKQEQRVIEFVRKFGENLGLETTVDAVGNVVIRKPATPGMENRATLVLQSHLDMVHQKNADTNFDFDKQGIDMVIDGDWVKARGTTLGADNGIGVAAIMGLLVSKDIPHPALEALFTIDEETGMTGALSLKSGTLHGKYLLNLDTEDDNELTIGCAGGIDVTATGHYETATLGDGFSGFRLSVKGLTGGHSGMDIHIGRGNANKIMNRLLYFGGRQFGLHVNQIDGGSLRNAIPRESFAIVAVPEENAGHFADFVEKEAEALKAEYNITDPGISISLEKNETPHAVMQLGSQERLLKALYACPNGIYRMSPAISGLVQTSNNVARVLVKDGHLTVMCLTRSSVDSEKMDLAHAIQACFELAGADVAFSGSYPGWTPMPDSTIVHLMRERYQTMFNEEPHVNACHAGLECGIIGGTHPGMEMISFGPNIRGAHSPDETVQVSSVQKFWKFLLETLKNAPLN